MEDLQRRIAQRKKERQKLARRNLFIFIIVVAVIIGVSFTACHRPKDNPPAPPNTVDVSPTPQAGDDGQASQPENSAEPQAPTNGAAQ